ncbi:MAG: family 78 glycoside hydrolase catalytic domain [Ignavibacteriae bacterium]|nr:family 78 glycoside hydrolase catalytic domain [Ignavibacteriota bacterium]
MQKIYIYFLGIHILLFGISIFAQENLKIRNLKCEYLSSPINIDVTNPRLSWIIKSEERGQTQTAYQIFVYSDKELTSEVWNSGKIFSSDNSQIIYNGKNLKSNSQYFWMIKIWDKYAKEYKSGVEEFWTSILDSTLWKANWIGANSHTEYFPKNGFFQDPNEQYELPDTIQHEGNSIYLRNEFEIKNKIKTARVFVTGLGFYEFYLNGKRIGDHFLAPAKTNYRKEVLYVTYDVTNNLENGKNAIGIHLGNGWFNPYKKWWQQYRMQWFGAKRALMQMHIEYENGKTEIITSSGKWKYEKGPVLHNCIYDGETIDANLEIKGWNKIGFDDSKWKNVKILSSTDGKLKSHTMPAVKIIETLKPIKQIKLIDKKFVFDFGQNFTGWIKISISGKKNAKIKLQFAEDINDDGTINITSNENAKAQYMVILSGDSIETFQPKFTYFGFKYVEVSSNEDFSIKNIDGLVLHTAIENAGKFECSNETINKIHNATIWSQKSNIIGYPMDCPQRDERLGWLGDAQVTIDEAMLNFDTPQFYMNWLSGIRSNQNSDGDIPIISPRPYIWDEGVEWSSTYIILVWKFYQNFGDKKILIEHYSAMKKYLEFLNSIAENFIIKKGWIGDWGSLVKGWKEGEPESVPTAFYFWNAKNLSKIANVLNNKEDEIYFNNLSEKIKLEFNNKFYNSETKNYNDGSQMANAFPLYLDLVPENDVNSVLENLVKNIVVENNGYLTTGVLGSKYMIDVLTKFEREDIAYLLATQTGYPSWSDMVEKYTTMCEFWTLKQSHNHIMTGSIDAFFYNTLAGIKFDDKKPGNKHLIIKPYFPENLYFVNSSIETINGNLKVNWQKDKYYLKLNIEIPVNSTAEIYIPNLFSKRIFENNIPINKVSEIKLLESSNEFTRLFVVSGNYDFIVK